MTYKAFVSYSHAGDGNLAPALQSALHRFAKPWYRLRAMRVFRDKTSLAMTPELWPSIEAALGESEHFLLLASPAAAHSQWVQHEVAWWLENRSPKSLFLLLTDGELSWDAAAADFDWTKTTALPAGLKGRYRDEPLWVDFRWAKNVGNLSLRHSRFRGAILDVAAPLHHRPKDELDGEDVRQHRRTKIAAWSAVLAVAAFAIVATWQWYVARQRYLVALSRQLAAEALIRLADQPDRALLLAVAASHIRDTVEAHSSLLTALEARPLDVVLHPPAGAVQSVGFGPQGALASGHRSGEVALWSLSDPMRPRFRLRDTTHAIRAVTFSSDGRLVAAADNQGQITLWDAAGKAQPARRFREHERGVNALAFDRDGRWLVSVGEDSLAIVRPTSGGEPVGQKELDGELRSVDVDPITSIVAIGSETGELSLWQPATKVVSTLTVDTGDPIMGVAFSPAGHLLVSASRGGILKLWDVRSRRPVLLRTGGAGTELQAIALSPDGHRLAVAQNRVVTLWDAASLRQIGEPLTGHGDIVFTVAFSQDGGTLASGDRGGSILVWNLRGHQPFLKHDDEIWSLAVSADGRFVATGSKDETIRVTEVASGKARTLAGVHHDGVSSVAFTSADGHRLASLGHDNVIVDWTIASDARPRTVTSEGANIQLAPLPAGDTILAASTEGRLARVDMRTGRSEPFNREHDSQIVGLSVIGTDRVAATVDNDGHVFVWDATTRRWLYELAAAGELPAKSVAFAPDGRTLAVGYTNGSIRLWDTSSPGRPGELLAKAGGDVKAIVFSSDGAWLASGDRRGGIRLWDVAARQQIGPELEGHQPGTIVTGLAFDPRAPPSWLLSAGDDTTALLWDLDVDSWRGRACRRANRDLTTLERRQYLASYASLAVCASR